ncbi:imidazole glycerol phosphate synthase subunit HisH [Buchnera aphidicola (Ceratovacuna keduensis)]|uniref:imidazole glycerol phosphate synthase subunit HisH n=1 Tax=Buchnera aphidicola TaxID=9 RepID=UPI0031B87847
MTKDIVIIDTGSSNISSLKLAINRLGYEVYVSNDLKIIRNSKKLFFPGIGSAEYIMNFIKNKNIDIEIINYKNFVLGICLGMQLFCKYSLESFNGNIINTLNIINSSSRLIKSNRLSIPHVGWNNVVYNNNNILFKNIPQGERFYFIHSYIVPINKNTISRTFYGEYFSSSIRLKNFFGVQFHPEKSGLAGSLLLKNFLSV